MAAKTKISIDLSGWYAKNARVIAAVRALKGIAIGPPEDDEENLGKAIASFDRGDVTYPASPQILNWGAQEVVVGLKEVANGERGATDMDEVMEEVGEEIVEDVRTNILGGQVSGPQRSERWIKEKGHDINMLGKTGDFVASLEVRLVTRR